MPDIDSSNLVLGPANLFAGAFGATEPATSAVTPNGISTPPDPSVWTFVGGTDGGVTFEVDNTYTDLTVDQVVLNVGARLTEMKMTVTAKLSEMTLENLNTALNAIATPDVESGFTVFDIPVGSTSTQPTYAALLIDGLAPTLATGAPALRRIIVRKVLSQTKAQFMFDKKSQQGYDCTFSCYYISSTIAPVRIIDQTA